MDQFSGLIEGLTDDLEKIGIYIQNSNIMTDSDELAGSEVGEGDVDVLDLMNKGEANFAIAAYALIGELAFDKRIVSPEEFESDQEFKRLVSEEDLQLEEMRRSMAEWREELDTDEGDK